MHPQHSASTDNSRYDRIFKENIDAMLPSIAESILQMTIMQKKDLPADIQHTKERKPDFLKEIIDKEGRCSVLHIECQTLPDPHMVFRMAEYSIMLQRKYKHPVKQYVLFLGLKNSGMKKIIKTPDFTFKYTIITIKDYDYNILLKSIAPENKIFSILCNFNNEDPAVVVKRIIDGLREVATGLNYERYINQLSILAQLRNLSNLINIHMNADPKLRIENNAFYQIGEERGRIKTAIKLKELGHDDASIAQITALPLQQIKKLKIPKPA